MIVTLFGMIILDKEWQFAKVRFPIDITLLGITTLDNELQELKTSSSSVVTPSGMTIQLQYLQPIITQYFIDNKSEIWLLFLIAHSKR